MKFYWICGDVLRFLLFYIYYIRFIVFVGFELTLIEGFGLMLIEGFLFNFSYGLEPFEAWS